MNNIRKLRRLTIALIIVALAAGASWFLVPQSQTGEQTSLYSIFGTPTTLIDLMLAVSSGVLFLRALRSFKDNLKPAWRLVATAQLAVGILTLVFPYIEYYGLWSNVWWNMSSYLAYLVGSVLMYLGGRYFLRIIGLRSRLTAWWVLVPLTLLLWGGHAIMPHYHSWDQFNEHQYDLFEIVPLVPIIFYAAASYMMFRIRRVVGAAYQSAFTWLAIGLGTQMVAAVSVGVLEVISYENWYFSSRLYELPLILGDIALMVAAYYFNAIGRSAAPGQGWLQHLLGRHRAPVTSLNIVDYVAGLASDPTKIDTTLDKVRAVSSRMTSAGSALSTSDQQQLRDVYLQLERYLVTDEPLRKFTQDSLRQEITHRFGLGNTAMPTFWPMIVGGNEPAQPTRLTAESEGV